MKQSLSIVKVGGALVEDASSLDAVLEAFARIQGPKVLVHGGGRTATKVAEALGVESVMVGGRRITSAGMLDVAVMVYAGLVSKKIVAALQKSGARAIGLSGADLGCIRSDKRPVGEIDYGFVGDVKKVDAQALGMLIDKGIIPVVCPITCDAAGQLLNTNADTIASCVACALAADYDVSLVYCFEKSGVLADPQDENSLIRRITRPEFEALVADGTVQGGMIPKLENAFAAIAAGVGKVIITKADNLGTDVCTEIV